MCKTVKFQNNKTSSTTLTTNGERTNHTPAQCTQYTISLSCSEICLTLQHQQHNLR